MEELAEKLGLKLACCDLMRVWRVKAQVCQHFEVFQHEFANFSLPCEGH